jgi:hypothetical protein
VFGLASRILRFWWVLVGIGLAVPGLIRTVRNAHRPGWFWFFLALVPVVVGITMEWHRVWRRANDEQRQLRGLGRRLRVELTTMELDLDRVEKVDQYDGFVPLPSATWTAEGARLEQVADVFDDVSEGYLKADAFNKDIRTRQALANGKAIGVIPQDGIPALRAAITKAKDALNHL